LVGVVGNRAVQIGTIVDNTVSPIMSLNASHLVGEEIDHLLILIEISIEGLDMS
jgi:hypothetical protein